MKRLSRCFMLVSLRACEEGVRVGVGDQPGCASEKNDGGKEREPSCPLAWVMDQSPGGLQKKRVCPTGKMDRGSVN